jgi:hypothetical protein
MTKLLLFLKITLTIASRVNISFILTSMTQIKRVLGPPRHPTLHAKLFSLSFSQREREKLLLGWDVSRWLYRGELTEPRSGQSKQTPPTPDSRAKIYLHKSRAKDWLTREQQRYQGKAHMPKGALHFSPYHYRIKKAHPFLPHDA